MTMKVYGSSVSYYTGKLEAYLRYKGISYELLPTPYDKADMLREKVGAVQMPIAERDDGRWMSDTTPILAQLETEHPACPIMPSDPLVRFIALLIEDYADEWLWRSAMHYRWSYRYDRLLISNILVDEVAAHVKVPRFLKRRKIVNRQLGHFVRRDGVTDQTRGHVEQGYLNALDAMSAILAERPFILGDAPSVADFGMMAPMFRHFGQDPTPVEIMRNRAPRVFEWVARMWNAEGNSAPQFVDRVPADCSALLKEICETHLAQLDANAAAYAEGRQTMSATIQACEYSDLPVSRYRVYCLEKLRAAFAALAEADQAMVKSLLPQAEAEILWRPELEARSEFDTDNHLPFGKAINVYRDGLP